MLGGFKNFVSSWVQKFKDWFATLFSATKPKVAENKVFWTFPEYNTLSLQETTTAADRGRLINQQMQSSINKSLTKKQQSQVVSNITKVASFLGMAFEIGVVINLVDQGLKLTGSLSLESLKEKSKQYREKVIANYEGEPKGKNNLLALLDANIISMSRMLIEKSKQLMNCDKLESVEYVGLSMYYGGTNENSGGADIIIQCASGETSYYSAKYTSNPHSSIAKKSPADIHKLFGGIGNRNDLYYAKLTHSSVDKDLSADMVLYDLWKSLITGTAVESVSNDVKAILKADKVVEMISSLLQGDTNTKPAWMNYLRGNASVGEYSPAMQRDFDTSDGKFQSRPGAYAEATLEGAYRSVPKQGAQRVRPAIKIKLVTPGNAKNRGTYLKLYVNPMEADNRWAEYSVQVQINNLTTQ